MTNIKSKTFSPYTDEEIQLAIKEISKVGKYTNIIPMAAQDKFIIIYEEEDKTQPPVEDITRYSEKSNTPSGVIQSLQSSDMSIFDKIMQNRMLLALVAGVILIIFFLMR